MASIAIIDDHVLLGEVLRKSLSNHGHDARVLDVGGDLIAQTAEVETDLTLLDLELGDELVGGQDLIVALRDVSRYVIVVSGVTDELIHAQCLDLGAHGVLSKASPFDDLVLQINECLAGASVYPPATERVRLLQMLAEHRRASATATQPFEALSSREAEVLQLLCDGLSATDISAQSFVAVSTVRSQIKAILRKLDVTSQLQAVAMAHAAGWKYP